MALGERLKTLLLGALGEPARVAELVDAIEAGEVTIGEPVGSATPQDMLFIDSAGNLAESDNLTAQDDGRILTAKGIFVGSTTPADFNTAATQAVASILNAGESGSISLVAVDGGTAGNLINIELVDDVSAGDETVEVTGVDIVVHIEAGVTTDLTVLGLLLGETDVTDLVTPQDNTDNSPMNAVAQTFLTGAVDATTPDENLYVQTKVQIGDISDVSYPGAILEIQSDSQGVLLPRQSGTAGITDPISGLLMYDTATSHFKFYNGNWVELITSEDAGNYLSQDGNSLGEDVVMGAADANNARIAYDTTHRMTFSYDTVDGVAAEMMVAGNTPEDGATNLFLGANNDDGSAGYIEIHGASSTATTGTGGRVRIKTGAGGATSGNGGDLLVVVGDSGAAGDGGDITVTAGAGADTGGGISLTCGAGVAGAGGSALLYGGGSTNAAGGDVDLTAGDAAGAGNGGTAYLYAGDSDSGSGGTVDITAGNSTSGTDGTITLTTAGGAVHVDGGQLKVMALGKGLSIAEGADAKMGTAVLVAGTVTVATTAVTANSRIFLTNNAPGGTPGFLHISARTASTSFDITSSNGADTSTIAWMIVEPS